MKVFRFCILIFLIPLTNCIAQSGNDSITAPASTLFKINGGKSFWMGMNYRKEWKAPIKIPVIDISKEKGGLTIVKRGGGKQTRSLRVADPNGREYNLRSIQKFITGKTLPADLQSGAAEDIVADGVSASYPYAALSMPVLAEAAGVPSLNVKVVYIPDDPKLGEHRQDFKNLLTYLEDRIPDSVDKGYDTEDVVKKLIGDNDNTADQHALLRARILDMYVMDFDRHEGQWIWGAYDKEKGKHYYPIPKDRDQAFYINQGVLPHMVQWAWLVPQLEGLKPRTKNIKRFNFAARNLDRFFLNTLSKEDWKLAVDSFLTQMTDGVIEKALAQQPPEIRSISTSKIITILKKRRKYLAEDVMEYYRFLAEIVDITASNKPELFDITRNEDGSVLLKTYKVNTNGDKEGLSFERLFDGQDTKEIRLYAFDGNDKFLIRGNEDKIKIRMIGGEGEDSFENTASSGKGGAVYDKKNGNNKVTGKFNNKMSNDTIANYYDPIYYKYNQVIPFVSVNYNPDDGVYLGASMKMIHHGFRKLPYKNSHSIALNHAISTKAFNFRYNAEFIGAVGRRTDLLFEADIKSPYVTNFFGYGESSVYDKTKPGEFKYYRTRYNMGDFSMQLRKNFSSKVMLLFGPTFQYFKLDSTDENNKRRFIVLEALTGIEHARAFAKHSYFGGKASLIADTRNDKIIPLKGILWQTNVRYLSGLNDVSYEFTQLNSDFTFYVRLVKGLILANRTGGGHIFGDFAFFQAQYLGGEDHLRGYRKNRFAGRSQLYNDLELRLRLANFKTYLFPGAIGLLAFYDAGRIWADKDQSDIWLTGYGGGIWLAPLTRLVLTFTYTASKEDKLPLVALGWKF